LLLLAVVEVVLLKVQIILAVAVAVQAVF